jgi:hypothetical protein
MSFSASVSPQDDEARRADGSPVSTPISAERNAHSPNYDDVIVREFGDLGKYLQRGVADGRRDLSRNA